jgi:hypothetical protein
MGGRLLQSEWVAADFGRHDTFGLEVPGEGDRLVQADLLYIEALAV